MANGGLREVIIGVITSWQVIAATVVILAYIFLVNYVARSRYRARFSRPEPERAKAAGSAGEIVEDDSELGLEKE